MEKLLSIEDVAKTYSVSSSTIRLWINKGILAYVEVGGHRLRRRRTIRITQTEAEKHMRPIAAEAKS